MTTPAAKEWMLGLPGHTDLVTLEEVARLITGGQLRQTDLVKKVGSPWRAANEVPELMPYFFGHAPLRIREKEPPRPSAERPGRATTRVPGPASSRPPAARTSPPASETRSGRTERRPAADGSAASSRPPAGETRKTEPAAPPPAPAATPPPPPRPPPRPVLRLEPMEAKYFSPVDLLHGASHAFDPRKLALAAGGLVPLAVFASLVMHLQAQAAGAALRLLLFLVAAAAVVYGSALIFMALAFVARRQLEGRTYRVAEAILFGTSNAVTAAVYPALVLLPSLVSLVALWLLGFLRDTGPAAAAALKIGYFVPMAFSLLAVAGGLFYQLASMYVPAAAAVEGRGLTGSVNAAWLNMRHQRGRVVLHWLIVTVASGVIAAVGAGLAALAVGLPEIVFARPQGEVASAWGGYGGLFALYRGLAFGLGLTLSVSLFSTLGVLSYLSLRHPVSAPLGPGMMDETGGGDTAAGSRPGGPLEATHPAAETPAAAETPGVPEGGSEIR